MTDWIRASNPTAPITTEAEAIAAARASALAIFLGVAWGIVGIIYLTTAGQAIVDEAIAKASADAPEMAGMAGIMAQSILWMSVFFVGAQLVFGLVQWAKPNVVVPIIFALLVAFGLVSGIPALLGMGPENAGESVAAPMWQTVIGVIILAIQLILHIAGIRGARKLDQLRFQAAQ